jgi:uncharacterized protein (DUF1501 family)
MSRHALDRREFLRLGLSGISAASTFPLFLGKTAAAAALAGHPEDDRILVVLQLSGGNDGLNTVVPYGDPVYGRVRSTLRLPEKDVLRIDGYLGLHPNLKDLKALYDQGKVAIVQGASYPNPTRSHFEAMDIWHAGDKKFLSAGTGWLGRAVDSTCGNRPPEPLASLNLGGNTPRALLGKLSKPICFTSPGAYGWKGRAAEAEVFKEMNGPGGTSAGPLTQLDFLRRVSTDAQRSSEVLRKAAEGYKPSVAYPAGNRLADGLRTLAGLIAAKLPTRVYYASFGGFDTHANQRGTHDNLMRVLSAALNAFVKDLESQGQLDRVMVMTFSEFGRRVAENGSRGTDHGVAAPMFLLGGRVRGGLHGKHPSLANLVQGDLAMGVDFRRVYAGVLEGWLGLRSADVLGSRYEPLELIGERRSAKF